MYWIPLCYNNPPSLQSATHKLLCRISASNTTAFNTEQGIANVQQIPKCSDGHLSD